MTDDQFHRMTALHDKLFELVMTDADPANWSAAGTIPGAMSRTERGDAQWCRKLASATLSIYGRVHHVLAQGATPANTPHEGRDDVDDVQREIDEAEAEAEKFLKRVQAKDRDALKRYGE